jgi:class 3 adenylate cyclase
MDYIVIGDNVNIAARLCNRVQPGQIVISKVLADRLSDEAILEKLEPVLVKRKDGLLDIYQPSTQSSWF